MFVVPGIMTSMKEDQRSYSLNEATTQEQWEKRSCLNRRLESVFRGKTSEVMIRLPREEGGQIKIHSQRSRSLVSLSLTSSIWSGAASLQFPLTPLPSQKPIPITIATPTSTKQRASKGKGMASAIVVRFGKRNRNRCGNLYFEMNG